MKPGNAGSILMISVHGYVGADVEMGKPDTGGQVVFVLQLAKRFSRLGYDVDVLNWFDIHRSPEKIALTIQEKRPDIMGFSILNANRWGGIEIDRVALKDGTDLTDGVEFIQPDDDNSIANIGDTVEIQDEDGEIETYRIVGVAESSPAGHR